MYHINKHGVPARCYAEPGKCPLGGATSHFINDKEAQAFIDKENKSIHGLLPQIDKQSLAESIEKLKLNSNDRTSKLPTVINYNPEANVRFTADDIEWAKEKGHSVDSVREILSKKGIIITDLDSTTEEQRHSIVCHIHYETYKRTGNIVGFLNSDKNSSYNKTKVYYGDKLEGSFEEIYGYQALLSDVGWHKDSSLGSASEKTTLNKMMDKEGLETAREILRFSEKNQPNILYPQSGIISCVQALRAKGWDSQQIKNASVDYRLDELVYAEYGVKPRNVSGAMEMKTIILRGHPKGTDIQDILKDKLGWDL